MKYDSTDLIFDLDVLEPILQDPAVEHIMVNGTQPIYVVRDGGVKVKTEYRFSSEERVLQVARNIVEPMGRRVDENSPLVDARLPDGTRVNVVVRPIALTGPTITLSKFAKEIPDWDFLVEVGSVTRKTVDFLEMCIKSKLNIMVVGGAGAGKTTIANLLSIFFDETERIVTIETVAELRLRHEHVVVLETRPPDREGKGEVPLDHLFINSVRMLPDRIIAGDVRSGEAWAMIQAMKAAGEGNLFTIHGTSAMDGLERLEGMAMMSGTSTPLLTIREQIASLVDVVISILRLPDGTRKIMTVSEVAGIKNNVIDLHHIFEYRQTGWEGERIVGRTHSTGYIPQCVEQFKMLNLDVPDGFFDAGEHPRYGE